MKTPHCLSYDAEVIFYYEGAGPIENQGYLQKLDQNKPNAESFIQLFQLLNECP